MIFNARGVLSWANVSVPLSQFRSVFSRVVDHTQINSWVNMTAGNVDNLARLTGVEVELNNRTSNAEVEVIGFSFSVAHFPTPRSIFFLLLISFLVFRNFACRKNPRCF